jgi:putative SOS response-associated peptidase YedK
MCGRYVTPDEAAMERAYNLTARQWHDEAYRPSYNVVPSQRVPVLRVIRHSNRFDCRHAVNYQAGDSFLEPLGKRTLMLQAIRTSAPRPPHFMHQKRCRCRSLSGAGGMRRGSSCTLRPHFRQ